MRYLLISILFFATTANAQIIHVPGNYPTIQQAIDAAQAGDTVLVANNVYYEQLNFNGKDSILLASHFIIDGDQNHIDSTILDGSMLTGYNRTIVRFNSTDSTTILAGMTIRNGQGSYDSVSNRRMGGGVLFYNSGGKLLNNKIINNLILQYGYGAGIAAIGSAADTWIVVCDNVISNNTSSSTMYSAAGGGIYIENASLRLNKNILSNNRAHAMWPNVSGYGGALMITGSEGNLVKFIATSNKIIQNASESEAYSICGGMAAYNSENIIIGNEFTQNESYCLVCESFGSALTFATSAPNSIIEGNIFNENISHTGSGIAIGLVNNEAITIRNNLFTGNMALDGAAIYATNASLNIENNVFKDNYAYGERGGAIYFVSDQSFNSSSRVINNTFSGNQCQLSGGAIASFYHNILLFNNIFWNNQAPDGSDIYINQSIASIAYCNIDPSQTSGNINFLDGNIIANPCFVDSLCSLDATSPCVDAGTATYYLPEYGTIAAPVQDINYVSRPQGNFYDMGAYEINITRVADLDDKILLEVYPNPASGMVNCSYMLEKKSKVLLNIYDIHGKLKYNRNFLQPAGNQNLSLDLTGFDKGIYLLKIQINDNVAGCKIINN